MPSLSDLYAPQNTVPSDATSTQKDQQQGNTPIGFGWLNALINGAKNASESSWADRQKVDDLIGKMANGTPMSDQDRQDAMDAWQRNVLNMGGATGTLEPIGDAAKAANLAKIISKTPTPLIDHNDVYDAVKNGFFVHGRNTASPFGDYMAQSTLDPETAIQYAGRKGSIYAWKPNKETKLLRLDDGTVSDILERLKDTEFEDYTHDDIAPFDLVNSAAAWDEPDFVNHFFNSPQMGSLSDIDAVIIPQGKQNALDDASILFNKNNVDYYKSKSPSDPNILHSLAPVAAGAGTLGALYGTHADSIDEAE